VDFSPAALAAARAFAGECGAHHLRFALSDAQACPETLPEEAGRFDLAFTSWGTIGWLPDLRAWARSLAHFLRPGGALLFADCHPTAQVFDGWEDEQPRWLVPYFERAPRMFDDPSDYADPEARLANSRTITTLHPLGDILAALSAAGFRLDWLREHDALPWPFYPGLVCGEDRLWRWPREAWLPLSLSLRAIKG
jgi:SAM-dependent methyltransferase